MMLSIDLLEPRLNRVGVYITIGRLTRRLRTWINSPASMRICGRRSRAKRQTKSGISLELTHYETINRNIDCPFDRERHLDLWRERASSANDKSGTAQVDSCS